MKRTIIVAGAMMAVLSLSSVATAVPYAANVTDLGGGMYSFTLNQDADDVTIPRTGDTTLSLGALTKGTHTFSIGGGSAFSIQVTNTEAPGWTQISNDADNTSKYYTPRGVAVNQNPASPLFGTMYVSEGVGGSTGSGRTTSDGVYVMDAAQTDVTAQGDTAWGGGIFTGGSSSPFKVSIGPDNTVYVTDWSDGNSGLWTADPNNMAAAFPALLDNTGRDGAGLVLEGGGVGPAPLHGSIPSVWVEGTGASRKVYTLDEDADLGGTTGSVLRYDVGNTTSGYNTAPVEQTQDSTDVILNLRSDVVRDEDGSWWIAQYRFTESAGAPSLMRFLDGGTAPVFNSAGALPGEVALPLLSATYGNLDIHDDLDLLVLGARSDFGVYVIDISDPDNPVLLATIPQAGYAQDVAFDAAGNVYVVSSSSETLKIWSPGGGWTATTGSDGTFTLIPEPASLGLLALGVGLALVRRRR